MARLTLTAGESVGLSSGTFSIFGSTAGAETVTIAAGTTVSLDASFNRGGDVISLAGNAGSYTAVTARGTPISPSFGKRSPQIGLNHCSKFALRYRNCLKTTPRKNEKARA